MAFALARSTFCGGLDSDEDKDNSLTCRLADWSHWYNELDYARQQGGLMMHHDAITGTAKDFVVRDYEERMATAMQKSSQTVGDMFELLMYGEAIPDNTYGPWPCSITCSVLTKWQLGAVYCRDGLRIR